MSQAAEPCLTCCCMWCGLFTTDLEASLRKFNEDLCANCGGPLEPMPDPEPKEQKP